MDMHAPHDILLHTFVHRLCVVKTLLWIRQLLAQELSVTQNLSHSVMQVKSEYEEDVDIYLVDLIL